jgi:hypothetical protein
MHADTSFPASDARRRQRWPLWLALLAITMVGLLLGGLWLDRYYEQQAWREACAEADRLDPGWRWDDLIAARPNPPDERNVAVRVRAVRQALPEHWLDWTAVIRDEDLPPLPKPEPGDDPLLDAPPSPEERRREAGQAIEQGLGELMPVRQLRPEQITALRAALATAAPALAKARGLEDLTAGRLPHERARPLVLDLLPGDVQAVRAVANLLRFQAMLQAQDGQADAALDTCSRALATAAAAGGDPMFISGLVEIAIRVVSIGAFERALAQGEPSPEALARAQRVVQAALARPLQLDMLRGERAFAEDCVRSVDEGLVPGEQMFSDADIPKVTGNATIDRLLFRLRGGGWHKRDSAALLRFQTALVEIAKDSPDALRERAGEVGGLRDRLPRAVRKAVAMYDQMLNAERRSRALLQSIAAALAAERFRRDKGRWPTSLDELVAARLLVSVPRDPFDGQPLRLRRLADGLVIYSVGADGADDGGAVRIDPNTMGLPKDFGVQLWDSACRRQPPPALPPPPADTMPNAAVWAVATRTPT